jgi:hypothetical protein
MIQSIHQQQHEGVTISLAAGTAGWPQYIASLFPPLIRLQELNPIAPPPKEWNGQSSGVCSAAQVSLSNTSSSASGGVFPPPLTYRCGS